MQTVNAVTSGNDLTGATVTRIRTMARFLDAVNFPGNSNPFGSPDPTAEFKREIYQMYRTAVKLEDKVIDLAFEMGEIEGLDKKEVKRYIRYLADRRLIQLGLKPNFKVKSNPLSWLDWIINGDSFKNFFEGTVTDYNASGMSGDSWGWELI